jgi:acyl carrier protein
VSTHARVRQVVGRLFHRDPEELRDDMGPGAISGWDSLGHVALLKEIQNEFGRQVPIEDAIEVESIGDLVRLLERLETGS